MTSHRWLTEGEVVALVDDLVPHPGYRATDRLIRASIEAGHLWVLRVGVDGRTWMVREDVLRKWIDLVGDKEGQS